MEFALEKEMHAPAKEWLHSRGFVVRSESPVPWGICDLIGCSPNRIHVDRRLAHGQSQVLGSHARALLFSTIPDENESGEGITLSQLCERLGGDCRQIECDIQTLVRRRFVAVTSSGTFKSRNGWRPLHRRLVAVELKVRRVPAAIGQAQRNLGFADESYVGLPMSLARRLAAGKRRDRFIELGVGLLGVAETGCRVLIASKPNQKVLDRVLQTLVVERFWAAFKRDRSA